MDSFLNQLLKDIDYLPSPIRSGTSNFVGNLSTLLTIPNNVLQGHLKLAGKNTLRFIVNTTVGILGIFDPASKIGLNSYEKEDYGQTLGVGELVKVVIWFYRYLDHQLLEILLGSLGNYMGGDAWYNITVKNDTNYFSDFDYYASKHAGGVDFRAKNFEAINNLEENSIDFYASVKSLYLQDRRKKIA